MSISSLEVLLQRLHTLPKPHAKAPQQGEAATGEFFFKIDFDSHGAKVSTVNAKGKNVLPDEAMADGERLNALRLLSAIDLQRKASISWGDDTQHIYLSQYPHLLYQVLRCDNLVNGEMRPLTVHHDATQLLVVFDEHDAVLDASFAVMSDQGLMGDLRPISDQFVLSAQHIFAVKPLGEQFALLPHFAIGVTRDNLSTYLSALLSYIGNVRIHGLNYTIERIPTPMVSTPTLVFERVEDDMTLNMRLSSSTTNSDNEAEMTDLKVKVDIDHERRYITIRNLQRINVNAEAQFVIDLLRRCAPSKADFRNLYVDWAEEVGFLIPPQTALAFLTQGLPSILLLL